MFVQLKSLQNLHKVSVARKYNGKSFVASSRQQWLRESSTLLRITYSTSVLVHAIRLFFCYLQSLFQLFILFVFVCNYILFVCKCVL